MCLIISNVSSRKLFQQVSMNVNVCNVFLSEKRQRQPCFHVRCNFTKLPLSSINFELLSEGSVPTAMWPTAVFDLGKHKRKYFLSNSSKSSAFVQYWQKYIANVIDLSERIVFCSKKKKQKKNKLVIRLPVSAARSGTVIAVINRFVDLSSNPRQRCIFSRFLFFSFSLFLLISLFRSFSFPFLSLSLSIYIYIYIYIYIFLSLPLPI